MRDKSERKTGGKKKLKLSLYRNQTVTPWGSPPPKKVQDQAAYFPLLLFFTATGILWNGPPPRFFPSVLTSSRAFLSHVPCSWWFAPCQSASGTLIWGPASLKPPTHSRSFLIPLKCVLVASSEVAGVLRRPKLLTAADRQTDRQSSMLVQLRSLVVFYSFSFIEA